MLVHKTSLEAIKWPLIHRFQFNQESAQNKNLEVLISFSLKLWRVTSI
jgi:hypothetical protein